MKKKPYLSVVINIPSFEQFSWSNLVRLDNDLIKNFENHELILLHDGSISEKNLVSVSNLLSTKATFICSNSRLNVEELMKVGLDFAIGDYVVQIYDHLVNIEFADLERLYDEVVAGYDVVSLVRKKHCNYSIPQRIIGGVINRYKIDLHSKMCRLLSRRAINALTMISQNAGINSANYEMIRYAKKTLFLTASKKLHRSKCLSKIKLINILRIALLRFGVGSKFSFVMSFFVALIAVALVTFTYIKLYPTFSTSSLLSGALLCSNIALIFIIIIQAIFHGYYSLLLNPKSGYLTPDKVVIKKIGGYANG